MEVILLERIETLGQMGEVVSVKPGYARNYLLPQKKALRATDGNRKVFETRRAQLEAENLERKAEAQTVSKSLDGLSVVLVRAAGENGQLYGSVSARDIADAVTAAGVTISRGQVRLDKALKSLGLEPVRVQLHPEVSVSVIVNIARSADEAETQARLGRALDRGPMEDEAEEEDAPALEELLEPSALGDEEGETEGDEEQTASA
jgi:large subunit ribosomal protein L9